MKFIIFIFLSLLIISGCDMGNETRMVHDCRQCDSNEFCKSMVTPLGHRELFCIKTGDNCEIINTTINTNNLKK